MSYILEALKKSEHERERGGVPGLKTSHHSHSVDDRKKSWWKYVLIFVISVNLVLVAALFYKEKYAVVTGDNLADKTKIALPDAEMRTTEVQTEKIKEKPVRPVASRVVKQIATIPGPERPEPESTQDQPVQKKIQTIKTDRQKKSGFPVADGTPVKSITRAPEDRSAGEPSADLRNVMRISQLPDSVQRNLPDLKYSGHLYSSNPSRRKLIINGRSMKEGEWVNNNLQLDEITMDGAIFSYKEYYYQVELLRNWSVN
ncbi:MAG: general secretion pathway protein GspB [Gammaproteobacteria bacterium]|nr:general secretion pathway protein GspB [Gammaproteobacteria bacterium]